MLCRVPRQGFPRRCSVVCLLVSSLLFLKLLYPDCAAAFFATALGDYDNVTVMEVSGNFDVIDNAGQVDMTARREVAREFYRSHGDEYDFLVIFTNFAFRLPPGARAVFSPARNNVLGIGLPLYDHTDGYSRDGTSLVRLEGTIDMASLSGHVLEPADPAFDDTLMVLTHEFMHRWGAYVHFRDGADESSALLGLGEAHWSYLLDSGGSTLYGNNWQDNGDGTFTALAPRQVRSGEVIGRIFNPLELYLMGMIDRSAVPPLLLIDAPGVDAATLPAIGVTIPGSAKIVTIDDIVAVEGERIPAATGSRKEFRVAFIYAVTPGSWSADNDQDRGEVAAINRLQQEWEKRFSILTDGTAMMRTAFLVPQTVESNPGINPPNFIPAVMPSVDGGVGWLIGRQHPDGSWQDQAGTAQRDTAAAIIALRAFPAGRIAAAAGQAWLGTAVPENNDFLARKLFSLGSAPLTELAARQNADGGWGSASGYDSNPFDTALLLQALAAVGSDGLAAAIDYLHASQNADGGWSPGPGAGTIQATAQVLLALSACRDSYPLEPAIADGLAWLAVRQKAGGGFGDDAATVVDTAAALQALRALDASNEITDRASAWLLDRQAADGSWRAGVFATALAVAALRPIDATPPGIGFVQESLTGYEGERTVAVKVGLSHPWNRPVTVDFHWTAAGTATPGDDFTLAAGTLIFPAGETERSIDLVLRDDLQSEPEESIILVLNNPGAGGTISSGQFTYLLQDNEIRPVVEIISPLMQTYASRTVTFDYVVSHGAVRVFLNGLPVTLSAGGILSLPEDGDYLLRVEATDEADRVGWDEVAFSVDTIGPSVSILSPIAGDFPETSPPLFYRIEEGTVRVVHLDGLPVASRSGDLLGPLSDGEHQISVTAADEAGNTTVATRSFVIAKNRPSPSGGEALPPELRGSREFIRTSYYERGAMTVDPFGNAYFATIRLSASANYDILVTKFDHAGQPLWPQPVLIDFPFMAYLAGLEVDGCGNVLVFGKTKDTNTNAAGEVIEDWDYDLFAARIDSAGVPVWTSTWGSIQNDDIYAAFLAGNGNLYITGRSDGPIDGSYGDNPGQEMFLTVLDATGRRLLNANYPNPTGWAIAADPAGNIFFGNSNELRKYSAAGQLLWSKSYARSIDRIDIDRHGDLLIGNYPLDKVDPVTGTRLWRAEPIAAEPFPGKSPSPPGIGWLGIDDNNDIHVLGATNQQLEGHRSLDGNDPYLAKFDRSGRKLWVKQLDAPVEGTFIGGFVAGSDRLYAARTRPASVATAPDYLFIVDEFALSQAPPSAGIGTSYYMTTASACRGATYNQGPVMVKLSSGEETCASPDQVAMTFKGSRELLTAYLANGGYPGATRVELAAFGNSLAFLAGDAPGTATVTLLEVDPTTGMTLRSLAARSFALTQGKVSIVHDLSGLSGQVGAGRTFGINLSMTTASRSSNRVSWGNAAGCPAGSRQYLRVIEEAVDGVSPFSAISSPSAGTLLSPGCSLVDGNAGDGAGKGVGRVDLSLDDGLTWQAATDTSSDGSWTSWGYPWCHPRSGRFLLRSRATDRAGNVESPRQAVAVAVGSDEPVLLTVVPAAIAQNESSTVTLTIERVDGTTPSIQVKMIRDVAGDGSPGGDPPVRLFMVTDGVSSALPDVPGDDDGQADGRIVTLLPFRYSKDVQMAPGDYLFVAENCPGAQAAPFAVVAASHAQTLQGYVLDEADVPLAGATVQLMDKWGNNHGYAFSDIAGHYLFNVAEPGEYLLVPAAAGHVFDKANMVPLNLAAGQQVVADLPMMRGIFQVAGQLLDAGSLSAIDGGILVRAESSRYVAAPMTDAYGVYAISLPAGEYDLHADIFTAQGTATQGYLGQRKPLGHLSVAAATTGNNLPFNKGTSLLCGQLRDVENMGIPGLVVEAASDSPAGWLATAVTDDEGSYCLGLVDDGAWQVALHDAADQSLGYVGTRVAGVVPGGGSLSEVDLTVHPIESWIAGKVVREGSLPVAGVPVLVANAATGVAVNGTTATDGSYRLGLHAGSWEVTVSPQAQGFDPVAPTTATVASGATVIRDFVVMKPVQVVNTIVVTRAAYDSRKKVLNVEATSNYANAQLQMVDFGQMSFSRLFKGKYYWTFTQSLSTKPSAVTVSGPEGSVTAVVR